MSATGSAVGRPLVVGLGGTEREGSVTEACVREALHAAELGGARVELFGAGAVGCIACAHGGQATATTLTSLRNIVHALRGWPTPLGVTVNSGSAVQGDGSLADQRLRGRLHVLGRQVVEFDQARVARG
jgi:FMN reductase